MGDVERELQQLRAEQNRQQEAAKQSQEVVERQLLARTTEAARALIEVFISERHAPLPFYTFDKEHRTFTGRYQDILRDTGDSGWHLKGYVLATTTGALYYSTRGAGLASSLDKGTRRGIGYRVEFPFPLDNPGYIGHLRDALTNNGHPLTGRELAIIADYAITERAESLRKR